MVKPLQKLSLDARLGAAADSAALARKAVTPVGKTMGEAIDRRSEVVKENEALKARVTELEAQDAVVKLDPALIDQSAWANRDEANFSGDNEDFLALKAEIQSAGGNVQPIKVRRAGERYEVVFGHRRLRACRELGLQVLAIVESLSDQDLFVQMDRENRARKNLSPYEQGAMYRHALAQKLFPSMRSMADRLGVDPGNVSKAMSIAELPEAVVQAFESKLDLQYRFAAPLSKACEHNLAAVTAKAREIARMRPRPKPTDVANLLVAAGAGARAGAAPSSAEVDEVGDEGIVVKKDKHGALTIKLPSAIDAALERKILAFIAKTIGA